MLCILERFLRDKGPIASRGQEDNKGRHNQILGLSYIVQLDILKSVTLELILKRSVI